MADKTNDDIFEDGDFTAVSDGLAADILAEQVEIDPSIEEEHAGEAEAE